ncbi:hypothetical protein CRG98_038747 [Punica granatum]|uniref:Uncharacterized protein n=1 Tax=Punica granatum TaxID=22663 RepID=A0A2I0IAQ8_PUNGR|nr:hypothetical protein CRG98_038747 [Punica granatum]
MSGDPKSVKQQMLGWSPWKAVKCGDDVRGPEVPKAVNARPKPVENRKCEHEVRGPEVPKAVSARPKPVETVNADTKSGDPKSLKR